MRKTNDGNNYIIFQKKNLLKKSKLQEDIKNRLVNKYTIEEIESYRVNVLDKTFKKELEFFFNKRIKECDVLDKSGYLKFEFNNNLKNRLNIYKKRKREKEISSFDFSIYEDDVLNEIKKCKNMICEKLSIIDIENNEFRIALDFLKDCNILFEQFNINLELKNNNYFSSVGLILNRLEIIKNEVINIENKMNSI